jgi:uncharacterized damage-inducible protein DinB
MFQGSYPVLLAEYNHWMNRRMYAACTTLDDGERRRDHGLFFKSIHATLNHLLWGDRAWMRRFTNKSYSLGPPGQDLFQDFSELSTARAEMDSDILAFARGVTPEWLSAPLTWTSQLYGFTQTAPQFVLVLQMFNHQTHHRGQVHAILTRLGVDMGPTDIPLLPVLENAPAAAPQI